MNKSLDWLEKSGFKATDQNIGKFGSTKGKAVGMTGVNSMGKKAGFRVEFDSRSGAHINVFSGKEKGPHFEFDASEKTVTKIQKKYSKVKCK